MEWGTPSGDSILCNQTGTCVVEGHFPLSLLFNIMQIGCEFNRAVVVVVYQRHHSQLEVLEMAGCTTRQCKAVDYVKFNVVGTTEDSLEEGQIADSPLQIEVVRDNFDTETISTGIDSRFETGADHDTSLDYDDILSTRHDAESVVTIRTSDHEDPEQDGR